MLELMRTFESLAVGGVLRSSIPLMGLRYMVLGMALLFMLLMAAGTSLFLYGAGLWLQQAYGREAGLMLTGGLCILIAASLLVSGLVVIARQKQKLVWLSQNLQHSFLEGIRSLDGEISNFAEKNPKLVLALAGLSGAILTKQRDGAAK